LAAVVAAPPPFQPVAAPPPFQPVAVDCPDVLAAKELWLAVLDGSAGLCGGALTIDALPPVSFLPNRHQFPPPPD
jgi:hypothetical protein